MNKTHLIEALMYFQGEKGLTSKQLKDVLDCELDYARNLLRTFTWDFNEKNCGLEVLETDDTFRLVTRAGFSQAISKLVTIEKPQRLSNAALETIGIIAYKQPITKAQINEIRGVASEAVVNTLLKKALVEETGIAKTVGNPVLYSVTNKFFDYFQIKSFKDLPSLSEFNFSEGIDEEFDLFASQREETTV